MWFRLLVLAVLLLTGIALAGAKDLAGAKEKVAVLAPSGLVFVIDEGSNELVAQNADEPCGQPDLAHKAAQGRLP